MTFNFKTLIFILFFNPLLVLAQNPIIVIHTELGDIELELYSKKAPLTVANFLQYIDEHRLDSCGFYRVVRDDNQENSPIQIQVIQGGLFEDEHPLMLPPIEHENTQQSGIKHLKGTISMARYEPGTATSEFFICLSDEPELDFGGMRNKDGAGFAAFGRVIKGMNIVKQIHQSPAKGQYLQPKISIYSISRKY